MYSHSEVAQAFYATSLERLYNGTVERKLDRILLRQQHIGWPTGGLGVARLHRIASQQHPRLHRMTARSASMPSASRRESGCRRRMAPPADGGSSVGNMTAAIIDLALAHAGRPRRTPRRTPARVRFVDRVGADGAVACPAPRRVLRQGVAEPAAAHELTALIAAVVLMARARRASS